MKYTLSQILLEYSEKNIDNNAEPVAVGKYGIRKRSEIYKKDLASDYSKNKLIFKDTLTIGLGSKQIDFGVLKEKSVFSVSPAYKTFRINTSIVSSEYLECYLKANNSYFTKKYMIASARQGKKVDIENLLNEELDIPSLERQKTLVSNIAVISKAIEKDERLLEFLEELIKSRFMELFGDPIDNPMKWDKCAIGQRCDIITGNTPPRADKDNYGEYIEWIKSDNINTPDTILTPAEEYLSEKGASIGRCVDAGSILMTCIAGSINCIGNVGVADRKVAFNQQINAIVPKGDETIFIYWLMVFSKSYIQSTINKALKGILSKGQLSEMEFPFPPLDLQKRFTAFIKAIDKTKSAIQKRLELYAELMETIMSDYFIN